MNHPVLSKFTRVERAVPAGFVADFLGNITDCSMFLPCRGTSQNALQDQQVRAVYPSPNEEFFEWIDILDSVLDAGSKYTFVELGAGYGRWMVRAAAAFRQIHGSKPFRLIGVEAEPTHFEWIKQHFLTNGINPDEHKLINAPVYDTQSDVLFCVGKPDIWYGQAIINTIAEAPSGTETLKLSSIPLVALLDKTEIIDLIDFDIQGAEGAVVKSAIKELTAQVKRLHIGTHSQHAEIQLRETLYDNGWISLNDFPCASTSDTEYGPIAFGDGVQSWLNPRLSVNSNSKLKIDNLIRENTRLRRTVDVLTTNHETRNQDLPHGKLEEKCPSRPTSIAQLQNELESSRLSKKRIQELIHQVERLVNPRARRQRTSLSSPIPSEEEVLADLLKVLTSSRVLRLHRFIEKMKGTPKPQ